MVDTDNMVSRMVFSRRVLTKIADEISYKIRSALLTLSRKILANRKQGHQIIMSNLSDILESGVEKNIARMAIYI